MQAAEHLQPNFLEINPIGKVPAIADGDFKLWESGAILLYLAQKYGKMPDNLEQQSEIVQWVMLRMLLWGREYLSKLVAIAKPPNC
ncbi:glutathione S-transferase N-terminal domain-containing protein [Tychonema sp. BBK16]|uniref:glutathione S-transferase N-terminal domain-containing protein n=1 Tax=Tychonema sp. BBK16 TaxID=2699888 RepID=UPI0030D9CE6C